jgi:hypothetical protein
MEFPRKTPALSITDSSRRGRSGAKEFEMRRLILVSMCLAIVVGLVSSKAHAITIDAAFAFVDRFPDEAEQLGFTPGNVVQLGAVVTPGDSPITEATARNLDTGLVVKLTPEQADTIYPHILFLYWPPPALDPPTHKGTWEIEVRDEKGNEVIARTHKLDKVGAMPYVANIKASGDPLAPMITWTAPKQEEIPKKCRVGYMVYLLKDVDNQLYRSKALTYGLKKQIPEGVLKPGDVLDTYIKIECQCLDRDDMDHPVPIELKSETFRPLKEALGK